MDKLIAYGGNIFAVLGVFVCLIAVASRLLGGFAMFGIQNITIFTGGIALILMSCLFKLEQVIRLVRR